MVLNFLKTGYQKIKTSIEQTSSRLGKKIFQILSKENINEETFEELEQLFYEADLGIKTSEELLTFVKDYLEQYPQAPAKDILEALQTKVLQSLHQQKNPREKIFKTSPHVILVVGVNGSGKTTSIAKMASYYQKQGKKVLIGAADTFRAAAIEQLEKWSKISHTDLVKGSPYGDPSAVVYDTLQAAQARKADVVLIDTAGRLHTKKDLMEELNKILRICKKQMYTAPHEIFLTVDASIGQNALDQAKTFNRFTPLTGMILTKFEGTSKGGTILAIQNELQIPVQFIGTGEGLEDLENFDPELFVKTLFSAQ